MTAAMREVVEAARLAADCKYSKEGLCGWCRKLLLDALAAVEKEDGDG